MKKILHVKFHGWRIAELQYLATLIAGRDMTQHTMEPEVDLYAELIREIRNRRVNDELGQLTIERFRTELNEEE